MLIVLGYSLAFPIFAYVPEQEEQIKQAPPNVKIALAASIGFGLAIAVFGGAIGQSRAISSSVEAMARQPEIAGRIFGSMVVGIALIETLVIYMFLICFFLMGEFTYTVAG
jgi:F-type H+-transporting ATPase subunit c